MMIQVKCLSVYHWAIIFFCLVMGGCASRPPAKALAVGQGIARHALRYKGIPYRYGGASPRGFDCSGLVYYVHRKHGLNVPRTAEDQWEKADEVDDDELYPGDLLFFRLPKRAWWNLFGLRKNWHVGIYVGQNRFVHAPSTGKRVRVDTFAGFWREYFKGAGRYWW